MPEEYVLPIKYAANALFWLIIIVIFAFSAMVGAGMWIFGFLAGLLSYVNPYKKIGKWIVIPLAVIYAIFNIVITWKLLDVSRSNQLIVAIVISALIFYITMIFSICISAANPKEILE